MSRKFNYLNNPRWRKLRAAFLQQHPLCVYCRQMGRTTAANTVDHIRPHSGENDPLCWDWNNLQALCGSCHSGPKQSLDRTGRLRGADREGRPLDPNHPWNRKP